MVELPEEWKPILDALIEANPKASDALLNVEEVSDSEVVREQHAAQHKGDQARRRRRRPTNRQKENS